MTKKKIETPSSKDIKQVVSWICFGNRFSSEELDLISSIAWKMRKEQQVRYTEVINFFVSIIIENDLLDLYEPDTNLATYLIHTLYDYIIHNGMTLQMKMTQYGGSYE